MNRRLTNLDSITLTSNSDAHSLENLGREANVFEFGSEKEITYNEIRRILKEGDTKKFLYTIEFHPEEGIYHVDGHRECGVKLEPEQSKKIKDICPVCKKKLTIGVLHRVDDLADRADNDIPWKNFIRHRYIVPLREIIAAACDVGKGSKRVEKMYNEIISSVGSEFYILLHAPEVELASKIANANVVLGIMNVRAGKVTVNPGYDGVYGVADVFGGVKYIIPKQKALL
jgi:PHP family Zn ribbon phosphoesterase